MTIFRELLKSVMSRKRRAESPEDDEESISSSEDSVSSDTEGVSDSDNSHGDEDEALVNCDFEFFDPQKQDFLGIKHLLRQLLDTDADLFDLTALTEMILAQPLVGSTVKTEGHEGDPLSFLTVLNLRVHRVSLYLNQSRLKLGQSGCQIVNQILFRSIEVECVFPNPIIELV